MTFLFPYFILFGELADVLEGSKLSGTHIPRDPESPLSLKITKNSAGNVRPSSVTECSEDFVTYCGHEKLVISSSAFAEFLKVANNTYPRISNEIFHLQAWANLAILTSITETLQPLSITTETYLSSVAAKSDFVIHNYPRIAKSSPVKGSQDKTIYVVGEWKLDFQFPVRNLAECYNRYLNNERNHTESSSTDTKAFHAVNQLCGYIHANPYCSFGLLSTVKKNFVFRYERSSMRLVVSRCYDIDRCIEIFVKTALTAFSQDAQKDALLQSITLQQDNEEKTEPISTSTSILSSGSSLSTSMVQKQRGSMDTNSQVTKCSNCDDFSMTNFLSLPKIEERGFVRKVLLSNNSRGCWKYCDPDKSPKKYKNLLREVLIYKALLPIQNVFVPTLLHTGWVFGFFGILTNDCGESFDSLGVKNLSLDMKVAALKALAAIHSYGILHGDIALRNLVSLNEQVFIIDFEISSTSNDLRAFEVEISELKNILSFSQ